MDDEAILHGGQVAKKWRGVVKEKDAEIARLQLLVDEHQHEYDTTMAEVCDTGDDTKHCACVPHLRKEITRLRAEIDKLAHFLGENDLVTEGSAPDVAIDNITRLTAELAEAKKLTDVAMLQQRMVMAAQRPIDDAEIAGIVREMARDLDSARFGAVLTSDRLRKYGEYLTPKIREVAGLRAELEQEERLAEDTINERDRANNFLQSIDVALGGSGEWSNNYDCGVNALERAEGLVADLAGREAELEDAEAELAEAKTTLSVLRTLADLPSNTGNDDLVSELNRLAIKAKADPIDESALREAIHCVINNKFLRGESTAREWASWILDAIRPLWPKPVLPSRDKLRPLFEGRGLRNPDDLVSEVLYECEQAAHCAEPHSDDEASSPKPEGEEAIQCRIIEMANDLSITHLKHMEDYFHELRMARERAKPEGGDDES